MKRERIESAEKTKKEGLYLELVSEMKKNEWLDNIEEKFKCLEKEYVERGYEKEELIYAIFTEMPSLTFKLLVCSRSVCAEKLFLMVTEKTHGTYLKDSITGLDFKISTNNTKKENLIISDYIEKIQYIFLKEDNLYLKEKIQLLETRIGEIQFLKLS